MVAGQMETKCVHQDLHSTQMCVGTVRDPGRVTNMAPAVSKVLYHTYDHSCRQEFGRLGCLFGVLLGCGRVGVANLLLLR